MHTKVVVMSQIVSSLPSAADAMNSGALVADGEILDVLLESLLTPPRRNGVGTAAAAAASSDADRAGISTTASDEDRRGAMPSLASSSAAAPASPSTKIGEPYGVLVDGFPRTPLQVDCVKLLYDKLMDLSAQHAAASPTGNNKAFPRPRFRVVILYVDEQTSVDRQLRRGREAEKMSMRAIDAGVSRRRRRGSGDGVDSDREVPEYMRPRTTDRDETAAKRRYSTFKEHYATLLRLKHYFPFTLIDAMGSLRECEAQISRELRYQSSLELGEGTFDAIRHIPIASAIANRARQQLVGRLDDYYNTNTETFLEVVDIINREVLPLLKQGSLAGLATYRTTKDIFNSAASSDDDDDDADDREGNNTRNGRPSSGDEPDSDSEAVRILMDVLADRGYVASHKIDFKRWPVRIDVDTGHVYNKTSKQHVFRIEFDRADIRTSSSSSSSMTARTPLSLSLASSTSSTHDGDEDDDTVAPSMKRRDIATSRSRTRGRKPEPATADVDFEAHFGYD